jgi:hypothetical protein
MKINAINLIFRASTIAIDTAFARIEARCFDLSFDLIDYFIDLMFGKVEEVTLRRQLYKWMSNILAVTHKVKKFNVVITIGNPNPICFDPVKPLNPIN